MVKPADRRLELLHTRAREFAEVTVANIGKEFPNHISFLMRAPGDAPNRPRELYPAFYGCFDWHSAVEMHWLLVRLLRQSPQLFDADAARAALAAHFTTEALAGEAAAFRARPNRARPYGWGWALTLVHELATWADPQATEWAANIAPLGDAVTESFLKWLPKLTYPERYGQHNNTAFGLSRALPYARARAEHGDRALLDAITATAHRLYDGDANYPANWEPSGADFLSPALVEAELMANLLPANEFGPWLDRFLPGVAEGQPAALLTPAVVSDDSDGQIAHLHGLNLSRAWCWRRLAETLPADDPRIPVMLDAAARHGEPELDQVSGGDYMVEHWLACYAVLYLSY